MVDEKTGFLVRGKHVLTSGPAGVIDDGAVRVVDDAIHSVGKWAELSAAHPHDAVAGGPNDLVTPGFVNTHSHFSEALVTGIAKDHTLWEWINALIAPIAPQLDREMARIGTILGAIQMLETGVTTVNDMFVSDPRHDGPTTPGVVDGLDEVGLRGVVSYGAGDVRGASIEAIEDEHAALAEAARHSPITSFRVGIAAVGAQSPDLFARSVELANAHGGSHIHLQEIREEVTTIRSAHGVTPIELCSQAGLFNAPTLAAHCVWVDRKDMELLADGNVGVGHNPVSNMILASGVCPILEMRRHGINVGVGIDGAGSNDRQDMLEAIKTTALLQRVDKLQATALSGREAFEMATIGGARALGMEDEIGSLEPGKQADIALFNGDTAPLANIGDPYDSLVFVAGPRDVTDVWVAGQRSLESGKAARVDVAEVRARSRELSTELKQRAGL